MTWIFILTTLSLVFTPSLSFYWGYLQYPFSLRYLVLIKNNATTNNRFCTGALISYNYVLTAANCTYQSGYDSQILAGVYNVSDTQEPTTLYRYPKNVITHPKWNVTSGANDIALIQLNEPMKQYTFIKPIELGDANETAANLLGKTGFSASFGITYPEHSATGYNKVVNRLDAEFISSNRCLEEFIKFNKTFTDDIFCSSPSRGNICLGDFGAPLVYANKLIGVASFGGMWRCGNGKPNVFTPIAAHLEWIKDNSNVN